MHCPTAPLAPLSSHGFTGPEDRGHVALCGTAAGLFAIRRPGVTLAVWRRRLPAGIAGESARLGPGPDAAPDAAPDAPAGRPSVRLVTTPDGVAADLAAALPSGWAGGPLIRDAARLVRLYAGIVGCPAVQLRLDSVAGGGCRFFHADHVGLRLLCTYRGAGTHWLPDDAVERSALGRGDNDAVLADPHRIRKLGTGHVGLLKGEDWPGNRGRGLVHRSPPADPSGAPRLLLCLDHHDHDED